MPKLPRLTAHQIIGVLEKAGFSLARQSGSHMIYKNAAGKRTFPFTLPRYFIRKFYEAYCAMLN